MEIVAFVDTLGFKQKISSITHIEAEEVIKSFNSEIYNLWQRLGYNNEDSIKGLTFSDSFIIYTTNNLPQSLNKILTFLKELYKISITKCDLPLRGGISIGNFNKIPAIEFKNLEKELVVGTAFIDAYSLESMSKIKGSKLIFRQDIHLIIENNFKESFYSKEISTKSKKDEKLYELIWADIDFLNNDVVLNKFVELACKSQWLDHYYHTLETFLTKENQERKHKVFHKILSLLNEKFKYTDIDNFIENFLKTDGITNLKKCFLVFLREQINPNFC